MQLKLSGFLTRSDVCVHVYGTKHLSSLCARGALRRPAGWRRGCAPGSGLAPRSARPPHARPRPRRRSSRVGRGRPRPSCAVGARAVRGAGREWEVRCSPAGGRPVRAAVAVRGVRPRSGVRGPRVRGRAGTASSERVNSAPRRQEPTHLIFTPDIQYSGTNMMGVQVPSRTPCPSSVGASYHLRWWHDLRILPHLCADFDPLGHIKRAQALVVHGDEGVLEEVLGRGALFRVLG